jgi:hypothetical protein
MLRRPPSRRRSKTKSKPVLVSAADARRRKLKRERRRLAQREYRRRFDAGRMSVSVEIDGAVVDMLIASNWLLDGESADRKKIGIALSAMIAEAAKP